MTGKTLKVGQKATLTMEVKINGFARGHSGFNGVNVETKTPEGYTQHITVHPDQLEPIEPGPREVWESLELGERFTFEWSPNTKRIKVTQDSYVVLGHARIYKIDGLAGQIEKIIREDS